jgi:hypothetical protein
LSRRREVWWDVRVWRRKARKVRRIKCHDLEPRRWMPMTSNEKKIRVKINALHATSLREMKMFVCASVQVLSIERL